MGGGALRCLGSGHSVTVPAFQAFSAFFYTVDFLRTVMGLPVATLQQLEAAVVTVCSQTWSEVRPAPRLHQGCAGWGWGFCQLASGLPIFLLLCE